MLPWRWLEPERVLRLTTPPLKRPNSAETLLEATSNSLDVVDDGEEGNLSGLGLEG